MTRRGAGNMNMGTGNRMDQPGKDYSTTDGPPRIGPPERGLTDAGGRVTPDSVSMALGGPPLRM